MKLRTSAPGIANGSLSFQKELLGLKSGTGHKRTRVTLARDAPSV